MKKPTFSKLTCWMFILLKNIFLAVTSFCNSIENTSQNLKNFIFQKNSFLKLSSSAIVLLLFFFLGSFSGQSQNIVPFTREFNKQLKGDILTIGNNILNRRTVDRRGNVTGPNVPYNGAGVNGGFDMRYINIDNGVTPGIFNSSSAKLTIPNNIAPANPCYRVAYAALYWSAILKSPENRSNINKVKIKIPNTGNNNYQDIKGTIIHDIVNSADGINPDNSQAYACFADITSLMNATNPNGVYTVANVVTSQGSNGGTGFAAGWSLFIVYEDASLPTKAISTFNGFTARAQGGGPNKTIIDGFTTIPTGPVNARFAFAALEGDYEYRGDYLQINGKTITPPTRPLQNNEDNFFNSSINSLGSAFTDRVPNSTNTLGFDTGVIDIDRNAGIIKNNDTSATITLGTSNDIFIYYFTAFSVDIIAPKIILTKDVKDKNNAPAGNTSVGLGDELRYELTYENVGNDNAKSFTITDKLPDNTTFVFPTDIMQMDEMTIPTTAAGNEFVKYDTATRTLTFTIPDNLVTFKPKSPKGTIKFRVKVVNDCSKLTNACSNLIQNTATSRYIGDLGANVANPAIYGDGSYSSVNGCNAVPQSTNFLVGLDDCKNRRQEICTTNLTISASGGYASYSWSKNASGTPVIGTGQTLLITDPGTYYVNNKANPGCNDLQEIITIIDGGGVRTNPILAYADNKVNGVVPVCTADGKPLPKIFLCGTNAFKDIDLGLTGATVTWEKTNCVRPTTLSELCANESDTCNWVTVGTNSSKFKADTAGYYRVTINSSGCVNTYYFEIYKFNMSITVTHKDILCGKNGTITAQQLTGGYEYSLTNVTTNTTTAYQDGNSFDIWNAGNYVVNYRLKNVSNTCEYKTEEIEIRSLVLAPKVENPNEQPLCFEDKGVITVSASSGFDNYYYVLYDGNTKVQEVGPISDRSYTFNNVTPGKYYEVEVFSMVGGSKECSTRVNKSINAPAAKLEVSSQILEPLTSCSAGKFKISATGGTSGYSFFIDGSTTAQPSSLNDNNDQNAIILLTPTAKDYTILVRDSKLCEKTIIVKVPSSSKPTYTISSTSGTCYGSTSQIKIENIVPNGYTMTYSINNGGSFVTNSTFSNLAPGTYDVIVKYGITYTSQYNGQQTVYCEDPAKKIIITGPTSAVTASAGVGELAGCGPLQGNEPTGLIRITNVKGGTGSYQYSFDGGLTWGTVSQKYVTAGDYNLAVKDGSGCIYLIPYKVTVDPKPADPEIDDNIDTIYNCDGTATATVIVKKPNNSGAATYTYEYYLQKDKTGPLIPNTPITNNIFLNVPSGSHNVIVKYKVNTVSSYSNLLYEDFGIGANVRTVGITEESPALAGNGYCFHDLDAPSVCSNKATTLEDNQYVVTRGIVPNNGAWFPFRDHTENGANPQARFLAINIGSAAGQNGILYSKVINDVIPNQPVIVEAYLANLFRADFVGGADPSFSFELVDGLGNVIAQQPPIPPNPNPTNIPPIPPILRSNKWELRTVSLNPGNNTTLTFRVRSGSIEYSGNDAAIDDISVYQIPKTCGNEKIIAIKIDTDAAFKASIPKFTNILCNGDTNGTITIEALNFSVTGSYQYNIDGGGFITTSVSPLVLTGFGVGTHTIIVRNDASGTCQYTLKQAITAPASVTVSASVTVLPTCTTGATITAVGGGGTPAYQYELRAGNGTTVITAFNNNAVFTNVPTGDYTVFTKDANYCVSAVGAKVSVVAPPALTATLDVSSDLCYDGNKTKLIVNVSGGTSTFTYKLDTATAVNTNIFNNVAPGTHTILVTDSKNCTATISDIIIAPELKAKVDAIKTLDCSATPDAKIDISITDGIAPYTYKWKLGVGNYSTSNTVTGNTFSYSTATVGSYTFEITDSKGCVTTTTANIGAISNPTATSNLTNPSCNNGTTGQIEIIGAGGSGNGTFTYSFNGNATFTSPTINTGLDAYVGAVNTKDYTYQVKDSKGCLSPIYTVTLNNPTKVVASASFVANTTCSAKTVITLSGAGGSGSYTYNFDGSATYSSAITKAFNNTNAAQTITYSVKDSKGCIDTNTIIIPAYNPPTGITISTPTTITCTATTTSLTLTSVAGVAPFIYTITSPASATGNVTGASSGIFTGLTSGVYSFEVKDANRCTTTAGKTIDDVINIQVSGNGTNEKCFGAKDGTATFTIANVSSVGNFTYTLSPTVPLAQITKTGNAITVTGLGSGIYKLIAKDKTTGCISNEFPITVGAATQINYTVTGSKISCNNKIATLSITGITGGSPSYTYAYAASPSTIPTTAYGTTLTVDTAILTTTIDVYVKDTNGCFVKKTVAIGSENVPTINIPAAQCYTGTPISVTITGTGTGTKTYSKDGITYVNGATFSLTPGNYTLYLKDGFGCIASTPYVVAPQLTVTATPAVDVTCTPNTTINLSANGGTGVYTYAVSFNGNPYSTTTSPYVTAIAGTYKFRVTDAATPACSAVSTDVIVVTKATAITYTVNKVDVKCKGDVTGSITITNPSGKAPFTYSITKTTTPFTNYAISNPTGLIAGIYDIIVTDALGCTSTAASVTITEPTAILAATAVAPATTTCSTKTTITVTATGGTSPYQYSFKGQAYITDNFYDVIDNGTSDQTISYQVKDANGCVTVLKGITVEKLNPPTGINFSTPAAITCKPGFTTTSITLTSVGGTAPFTYAILSGPTSNTSGATSGTFTGLTAGTYTFEVKDANGCKTNPISKTIDPAATISASGVKTDIICFGNTDGTATFTVTGASSSGNFNYVLSPTVPVGQISKSGNVIKVTGLGANTYTLTATDITTGCVSNTASVKVSAATQINYTVTGSKISCNNKIATLNITGITGGSPSYTYAYAASPSTVPTTAYGTTLTVDTAVLTTNIDVYVKDNNGCFVKKTLAIGSENVPTINTPAAQCYTGTPISVTITGTGTGTKTYSKDGTTYVSSATFSLTPGNYTLYLKDGFGCVASTPYKVAEQLTVTATPAVDVTCTPNTTINLTATGGTGAYTYEVSSNGGTNYVASANPYVTAIAGTYKFRVTDAATPTCSAVSTDVIVVTKATAITYTVNKVDVKCKGDATGSITITNPSGKAPFTYSVKKSTSPFTNYAISNPTGLIAGTYDIIVTDALGCTSTAASVTITEPANALAATATAPATTTCSAATTVTVTATVGTGTGPYTYSFDGGTFTSTNTKVVNDNGTSDQIVAYRVQDANGCITVSQNITVKKLNKPTDLTFTPSGVITCSATSTTITLGHTGGTGTLQYETTGTSPKIIPKQTSNVFAGLTPGTYFFLVTDQNGCSYPESYVIKAVTPIAVSGAKLTDVACFGDKTGSGTYTVSGNATPGAYTFTLTAGTLAPTGTLTQSGNKLTLLNVAIGTYTVEVTDTATQCKATASIIITQPASALSASIASKVNANCDLATSKVTVALPTGGTAPYTYAYKEDGVAPVPTDYVTSNVGNLNPTTNPKWDVWVKDSQGCTIKIDVDVFKDATPTVTATVTDQCTGSGSTFTVKAVGASGVTPYTYSISTGVAPTGASLDTFAVAAGTYTITVTDKNGCTATTSVTVNEVLEVNAIQIKELTCDTPTPAQIDVTIKGGKASFSYKSSFNGDPYGGSTPVVGNKFTFNPTVAGTYQFEITDSNLPACPKVSNIITVAPIVRPVITAHAVTQTIKCNGEATGIITVTPPTTGVGPYEYSIDGGTFQQSNVFTGLLGGAHSVTVKDSKGCTNVTPYAITIAQPKPMVIDKTVVPITCSGAVTSTGSITINKITDGVSSLGGTGGTAPYTYYVTGINGYNKSETNPGNVSTTFSVVDFGLYQIRVVDANGCSVVENDVLVASPINSLGITVNPTVTCTGGSAVVKITSPLSGVGPFHFNIYNGPGQLWDPLNLPANIANGWIDENPVTSKETTFNNLLPGITYTFIVYSESTKCYYFETAKLPVPSTTALSVGTLVAKNITCKGSNDGNVSFKIVNSSAGSLNYTYEVFEAFTNISKYVSGPLSVGGSTSATINSIPVNLSVGSYYVYVREASGCGNASANFNIKESPVLLSITALPVKNENCNNLGTISAEAKDGTGPYLYMITTTPGAPLANNPLWASTNTFAKAAGSYYVHAKDAYGCIKTSTVVNLIKDPTPIIAPFTVVDLCAAEGNFTLNIDLSTSGVGPYTVSVNGAGFKTMGFPNTITGLSSGLQTIIVKDANGCENTRTYTIIKKLSVTPEVTKVLDCTAFPNATIKLTVTDGTPDFGYEVSINGTTYAAVGSFGNNIRVANYSAATAGTYKFRITDSNGCKIESTVVTIAAIPTTVFTAVPTLVSCNGGSDGKITVNVTAGAGPYTYALTGGAVANTTGDATGIYTGLPAGTTYVVTVRNAKNCTLASSPITVGFPTPVVATATITTALTCDASNNAKKAIVTVVGSGGTGAYEYSFDGVNYSNQNTYETSTSETVIGYVRDANKCVASDSKIINTLNPPTDMAISSSPVYCMPLASQTSTVTITGVTNGVGTLQYEILSPIVRAKQTTTSFANLAAGDYTFQVTDANGCTYQELYTVKAVVPIAIVGALDTAISCKLANGTNNNGSAKFTVTGFSASGNYTVAVTTVPAGLPNTLLPVSGDVITLTGLVAGTYTVTVTDKTTGCQKADSVILVEPTAITFTTSASKVYCSNDISQITVSGVAGGTGVYTYAAVKGGVGAVVPSASAYGTNPILSVDTNLLDFTWDVYVKDANGCVSVKVVTPVVYNVEPTINAPAPQCFTGTPLTVDLSTLTTVYLGSSKSYTVNGSPIASSIASFNAPGTYQLGIKDDNGCEKIIPYTIEKQLLATATLTKDLFCTGIVNATIKVDIQEGVSPYKYQMYSGITPVGPLTSVGGTSFTASVGTGGNYSFVITDTNAATCSVTTNTVVVTTPATPTFTTTQINVSCTGGNDGSITVIPANGVAPYTFVLSGVGANTTGNTTGIYTGLIAGSYTMVVTDAKGCSSVAVLATVITQPVVLTATHSKSVNTTCSTATVITVVGQDGTPTGTGTGYYYSFDGGATYDTSNTFTVNDNGAIQTILYTVKDANGCTTAAQSIDVNPLNKPTDLDFLVTVAPTCPVPTTTVRVKATNGVGALKFEIIKFNNAVTALYPAQTTTGFAVPADFAGLIPGNYTFQVTDANGCTYQELYTVKAVVPIAIVGVLDTSISCKLANGTNNNGSAKFTVTGFSASGNYTVVTSPVVLASQITIVGDVITLTGLSAGTYTVTVTDKTTGCQKADSVTLVEPTAITFTTSASKVYCSNDISQITVSGVAGGTGVYTYAVVKGGVGAVVPSASAYGTNPILSVDTNLTDLTWDVYVKDANGCVSVKVFTPIVYNAEPTITAPAPQCFTGTPLTVNLSGLTTVYGGVKTYTVNGSPIASSIASFNAPGTYQLGIKDDNGCEKIIPYTIVKQLLATATLTKDLYCAAPIAATIEVKIEEGVPPYTYQMYLGVTPVGPLTSVGGTSFTESVTTAGTYSFVITDANAATCSVTTNTVVVTTPVTPTFTKTQINVSCFGGNDGSITVIPANGVAPYTFVLSGVGANTTGNTTGIYTGLIAGSYTMVVTDAKGCSSTISTPIVITQPFVLKATASASANTTCSTATVITVVGQDGTPTGTGTGYYYSFDGGATYDISNTFTVNDNGAIQTILYAVKDANGCPTTPQPIVVNPLNKPTDLDFALTVAPTCPSPTATVTITGHTGGVGTLQYEILSPIVRAKQTTTSFANLPAGDYTFQVTDANGCTYQEFYTVKAVVPIAVNGQLLANMTCNTGNDGKASFGISDFSGNYTYAITKNGSSFVASTISTATSIPLKGLGFGVYVINISDNTTLCTATATVTIAQPSVVNINVISNVNANCNSNAIVQVAGAGGTPDYTYAHVISGAGIATAVFGTADTVSLDPAISTTWDFYAKDANGCISAVSLVTIMKDPLPAGFAATATQCPTTTGTYDIIVTTVGTGMAPYEYSIGSGFQTSTAFTVNAPGTYDLIVKDKFGCTTTFPAAVLILKPIVLQTNITVLPSCTVNNGSITAIATGGSGNYSYKLGAVTLTTTPAVFSGLGSGLQTIVVTDLTTNCTDTASLNLGAATPITGFSLSTTQVTCKGGNDGTITAIMATPAPGTNDNPVYMYSLNGGTQQGSNIFTGLTAANGYSVTVISGRGCQATATINVIEPAIITVPAPTVAQFGCTTGSNVKNLATITVTGVTGGSTVYANYEFIKNGTRVQFGTSNVYIENNTLGGSYSVNVFDDKGCVGSTIAPIVINQFISLDKINVSITNAITCTNNQQIKVTVDTTGGTPAIGTIMYTVSGLNGLVYSDTNTTGIFNNLVVGDYSVAVKYSVTGCTTNVIHYVNKPNTFELKAIKTSDVVCFGSNEGAVELTIFDSFPLPTNEAGVFDYVITSTVLTTSIVGTTTGANSLPISGLKAGLYNVSATLKGSPFCTVSTSFTIVQPDAQLAIKETHTIITCVPGSDGSISVVASGGWGDYEFQLVGPVNVAYGTDTVFANLIAGNYTVNVKDSKGCIVSTAVQLTNPTPITVSTVASTTIVSCNGDKSATITASATGGQGSNYLFTLNDVSLAVVNSSSPQSTGVFTGLGAGKYSVTVTDGLGCTATSTIVVIAEPTKVEASLVLATTQTCLIQSTLTLTATGGTGSYTYSSDPAFSSPIVMIGNSATFSVANGVFRYYVRDANGCTSIVSNDIQNDALFPLTIDLDVRNPVINCKGDLTGVIVGEAKGGLGNYIYTLQDASGAPIAGVAKNNTGIFTDLAAGNYKIYVESGDCYETSILVPITEPNLALIATYSTVDVSCNGNGDGQIIINVPVGVGTGTIKFAISPNLNQFFETGTFNNMKPGFYDVIVQDQNGCFVLLDNIEVKEPAPIAATVVPGSIKQSVCSDLDEGAFSITIAGGVAPYKTSLDNPKGTYVIGQVDFKDLTGGSHTVYIIDANTCTFEVVVPLDASVTLNPEAKLSYDCVNDMPANKVTVTIDPSNNAADVTYSLDSSGVEQTSNIFTNIAPGEHFIIAHHANGCVAATEPFRIDKVDPLTMTLELGALNEIVFTTKGGSGPGTYVYTVNGEFIETTNKYVYFQSGNYVVTVTDANGCSLTVTKYFEFIDIKIPNVFTPDGNGNNDTWNPTNTSNYPDIQFVVYDRYSREVGRFGAGESWDGKYKGAELPMGDYWYVLKLRHSKDDREFIGHFTLYR